MVGELIDKYIYLIQTLIASGRNGLTLADLSSRWERRYDTPLPRRSFNNHRDAIAHIFGIEIDCDRSTNSYYISYGADVTDQDASRQWLINTFTVGNLLSLGQERLSGRVSVEEIPSGQLFLTPILSAMDEGVVVELTYRKYTSNDSQTLHVRPYALKEFQRRWYLAGWCSERAAMRVYALDRVVDIRVTPEHFSIDRDFNVETLFEGSFGIYLPEGKKVERVDFAASDDTQARFLRDLPLHRSQIERPRGDDGRVIFSIFVIPDEALVLELLKLGGRIEVLAPASLRMRMSEEYEKALTIYEDK